MNNILRFPRGELKRRAHQRELLQEIVFNAETNDTRDIEIVTLKQHLRDRAMSKAWEMRPESIDSINERVEQLLNTEFSHSKEFVEIDKHGRITVGVNALQVTDGVVDQALALLIQVDDITKQQVVTFGEVKQIYGAEH